VPLSARSAGLSAAVGQRRRRPRAATALRKADVSSNEYIDRDAAPAELEREQHREKKEESMTDQNEHHNDKTERRAMWIMTALGVLIILGLMGMNMLTHPDWMHGG
jgi:hypothetical protein